jgi:hypothetical protein
MNADRPIPDLSRLDLGRWMLARARLFDERPTTSETSSRRENPGAVAHPGNQRDNRACFTSHSAKSGVVAARSGLLIARNRPTTLGTEDVPPPAFLHQMIQPL